MRIAWDLKSFTWYHLSFVQPKWRNKEWFKNSFGFITNWVHRNEVSEASREGSINWKNDFLISEYIFRETNTDCIEPYRLGTSLWNNPKNLKKSSNRKKISYLSNIFYNNGDVSLTIKNVITSYCAPPFYQVFKKGGLTEP